MPEKCSNQTWAIPEKSTIYDQNRPTLHLQNTQFTWVKMA